MTDQPTHVFLIDGSGFLFRAFHALPPMTRGDGAPVNAVFGFTKMVMKLIDDTDADHIAVIFDRARKTFRSDIYAAYKANRPPPPQELIPQFRLARDATEAMNVPAVDMDGFEADDLIATYARQAAEAGAEVTIVSSDKDLMQLVTDKVTMLDAMKNRIIGHDQVVEKFGVGPDRVVDVQALAGDSADNVPGVKGIGDDTAAQLIAEYGSLDGLIAAMKDAAHLDQELPARMSALEAAIQDAAGRPVKLGSAKDVAELLYVDLEILGRKAAQNDADVRRAIENKEIKVNTADLKSLADKGQTIAGDILQWRFLRKVRNSFAKTIVEGENDALISRQLAQLDDDAPVTETLGSFAVREPDPNVLLPFLKEQNFRSLVAAMEARLGVGPGDAGGGGAAPGEAVYELVQTEDALEAWVAEADEAGAVAVDTETTGLDSMRAGLVGVSLSVTPGRACYIPLAHTSADAGTTGDLLEAVTEAPAPEQVPMETALALLKPLLEDPAVLKIGQNVKYDKQVLVRYGIDMAPIDDTMLISYVLEGGLRGHGMDELARGALGVETTKFKDVAGAGKSQITFDKVALDKALDYAAEDADITLRLFRALKPRLARERMAAVYETLERPLVPVLEAMEREGVKVDARELKRLSDDFGRRMADLEERAHKLVGREFNVGSPKQLGEILFDEMGLKGGKKGKAGAYSTGADVLEGLAAEGHGLPKTVLEFRQLSKLKSTYADALTAAVNPQTGRVHTSYSQAAAATGRLASTDPNLQNIPVRTEEGRKIRKAFVPEKGRVLVSADYSQIELRILAHVAGIDALKQAFHDGQDIHALTASQVFGEPIEGMDPMTRRNAKAINFGIIYGISAFGLARQLGIPNGEAKAYIDAYFDKYPGIKDYMERTKAQAREQGFVTTLFGRKCHARGINERNPNMRGFAERAAINAPIQGGAADIIKRAMIRVPGALRDAGLGARMLLQVHDELIFEAPEAETDDTIGVVRAVMEGAARLDVPLVVDAGAGMSWDEAH